MTAAMPGHHTVRMMKRERLSVVVLRMAGNQPMLLNASVRRRKRITSRRAVDGERGS